MEYFTGSGNKFPEEFSCSIRAFIGAEILFFFFFFFFSLVLFFKGMDHWPVSDFKQIGTG
jgi:hypothetical protein